MNTLRCRQLLVFLFLAGALRAPAAILQEITENVTSVGERTTGRSHEQTKNVPREAIEKPGRDGIVAFKHPDTAAVPASELVTLPTKLGDAYWYGWSLQLPDDF